MAHVQVEMGAVADGWVDAFQPPTSIFLYVCVGLLIPVVFVSVTITTCVIVADVVDAVTIIG